MPSRLLNLRHQLRWRDFQGQVPPNSEFSAETDTKMRLRYGHASSGGQTRLTDNVVVTVQLRRAHSWAKAGAVRTAALLNHEQRHYDITALMSRDFFIDMMQLKTRTFPSTGDLDQEVSRLATHYASQPIHDQYDDETDHGQRAADQRRWDCMINRAFSTARSPAVTAPDGTPYKIRLLNVLNGNAGACVPATP